MVKDCPLYESNYLFQKMRTSLYIEILGKWVSLSLCVMRSVERFRAMSRTEM
jgi:hypothetical protein